MMWQKRMSGRTILVSAGQADWDGWLCMDAGEFLQRIDLSRWHVGDRLVGMVLPTGPTQPASYDKHISGPCDAS